MFLEMKDYRKREVLSRREQKRIGERRQESLFFFCDGHRLAKDIAQGRKSGKEIKEEGEKLNKGLVLVKDIILGRKIRIFKKSPNNIISGRSAFLATYDILIRCCSVLNQFV
eukprot:TRINITY_DN9027_c0_g2_i2.p1 TRINITY_DN9027_c0_g2~~TRINITY_DN9027_c0_g2_i2.p1  ORF type:complete len:112 (+),score=7.53 TRINITY_DN9027_c0_g2_i2:1645-1980(+)